MLSERKLQQVVAAVHSIPELRNVRIGYCGDNRCRVLFEPRETITGNECRFGVVLEESKLTDDALIAELQRYAVGNGESAPGAPNPEIVTNRSRLGPELIGAMVACGLTIVAAAGMTAGVAAEIPTGGASTFLVYAGWVGLTTGAIQCANGLVRVNGILAAPNDNSLQRWDKNPYYEYSILVVDALGVASGVASLPFQARNLYAVLARQKSFVARGLNLETLRAMNRAQRLKVVSEVFAEAARTPDGRAALLQSAREAGLGARTLQSSSGMSVRASTKIASAISIETARRLKQSIWDVVATVSGVTASGLPSEHVGSASGSVNYTINLIESPAN
ncbi:MAG: hypothetical protein ABW133_22760 [Polyangiaceae bacterium]